MGSPFEKLIAYQKALTLADKIEGLCDELKGKISFSFQDQIRRAALSISLNIAEGNGRWHVKDKQQFFWIARGSAFEVIPLLQLLSRRTFLTRERYEGLYNDCEEIAKMLTSLIKSVEELKR